MSALPPLPYQDYESSYETQDANQANVDWAAGHDPCFLCGKGCTGKYVVHLRTDGMLQPVGDDDLPEYKDQGWFPIGPECRKKLPDGYVAAEVGG